MDTTQGVAADSDEPTPGAGPFQEQLTCSFAYKLVSSVVPDFSRPLVSYRGEDAGEMFVSKLQEEAEQLLQENVAPPQQLLALTEAELRSFHTTINCHIFNQPLGGNKVRDHCHIAGNYRGAAHSRCNLAYIISKSDWKLPVIIHNLKRCDGHFIVKALKGQFGEVRVIPQKMEKYLSITVDRLAKTPEVDEFKYVLPSQDAFFGKLFDSSCSVTEYAHATQVWTVFECESMADYHDIYLKCDVLLLTDFFEKFRATCLAHYSLDDVHYYTAHGLDWDAALRMTHVSLELMTDIVMYHFIENSIRVGPQGSRLGLLEPMPLHCQRTMLVVQT